MFSMVKNKKYFLLIFQNITQIVKNKQFFNNPRRKKMAFSCSQIIASTIRGIMSKHHGDFYCLRCLHSFTTEKKRESYKRVYENKYFCNVIMPSENTKILEFNQYQKSNKAQFVIYADLQYLIEKIHGCKNYPENSPKTKVSKHILSDFQCLQYHHLGE